MNVFYRTWTVAYIEKWIRGCVLRIKTDSTLSFINWFMTNSTLHHIVAWPSHAHQITISVKRMLINTKISTVFEWRYRQISWSFIILMKLVHKIVFCVNERFFRINWAEFFEVELNPSDFYEVSLVNFLLVRFWNNFPYLWTILSFGSAKVDLLRKGGLYV